MDKIFTDRLLVHFAERNFVRQKFGT